jgi:hypothetical protein
MAGGGRLHIASHATRDSALTRQTTPRNMHVDHRCDDGPSAEYVGSSHRSPSSRVKGHRGAVVPGTGKCGGYSCMRYGRRSHRYRIHCHPFLWDIHHDVRTAVRSRTDDTVNGSCMVVIVGVEGV